MKLYLVIMKDMCQYVEQERTIMNYDKSINTCKLQLYQLHMFILTPTPPCLRGFESI